MYFILSRVVQSLGREQQNTMHWNIYCIFLFVSFVCFNYIKINLLREHKGLGGVGAAEYIQIEPPQSW